MVAGHANRCTGVTCASCARVELIGGFRIVKRLLQIPHVIQRKGAVRVELVRLLKEIQGLVRLVMVKCSHALYVQPRSFVLRALLGGQPRTHGSGVIAGDLADWLTAPMLIERDHDGIGRTGRGSLTVVP